MLAFRVVVTYTEPNESTGQSQSDVRSDIKSENYQEKSRSYACSILAAQRQLATFLSLCNVNWRRCFFDCFVRSLIEQRRLSQWSIHVSALITLSTHSELDNALKKLCVKTPGRMQQRPARVVCFSSRFRCQLATDLFDRTVN
jgi:hypothetical protein